MIKLFIFIADEGSSNGDDDDVTRIRQGGGVLEAEDLDFRDQEVHV